MIAAAVHSRPFRRLSHITALMAALTTAMLLLTPAADAVPASDPFREAVDQVLALPYNATAAPTGIDSAFGTADYPAAFPLTDTAGGACCTGPVPDQPPLADLAPPFAEFPDGFELIELESIDGTPLHAFAALRPGAPGIVVMHGFNTNGKYSVVRYAAFLYSNGYSVIVPDHRDMGREWSRNGSYHPDGTRHGQTLGWKEAEDLLTAVRWLDAAGTSSIGVLGFSEGAQNTILAMGIDYEGLIDAVLTFSPPADQPTLAQRSPATTAALLTTVVGNPDLCGYLATVGAGPEFGASANFILARDSAMDALDGIYGAAVTAPGLHFYTNDDTLVPPWNATLLASRTNTMTNQHTVLLESGNHAYFTDRWWTQMATLTWFATWLDPDGSHTTAAPSIARTPGGTAASSQTIDLTAVTRAEGDATRLPSAMCEPSATAIGPSAVLESSPVGPAIRLDGRRSYSGWDDHEIVAWSIDPGDGSAATSGGSIASAMTNHHYAPGTYTAVLTVTDDTGRTDSAALVIEVAEVPQDSGRAHGAGFWVPVDGGKKIAFSFDVRTDDARGRLFVQDRDAAVKIDARSVERLHGATGVDCGGEPLIGSSAFAFFATGGYEDATGEHTAEFFVCGSDSGQPGMNGDRLYVECRTGCSYAVRTAAGSAIGGGNVRVSGTIAGSPAAPEEADNSRVASLEDGGDGSVLLTVSTTTEEPVNVVLSWFGPTGAGSLQMLAVPGIPAGVDVAGLGATELIATGSGGLVSNVLYLGD